MRSITDRTWLLVLFLLPLAIQEGKAQMDTILVPAKIINGDTVPMMELNEIPIIAPVLNVDPIEAKRFAKLVFNVKKVYPYARLAGLRFRQLESELGSMNRKARKEAIKKVEDEVKDKYGPELKKLSFSQGKILIKLLDRETGNSSYDLIQDLKGSMMAFFFQGFARFWGYNLKTEYDPEGEDKEIEMIVQKIERGEI